MSCVVLCYHRVLPDGVGGFVGDCHRVRGTVVSVATFERQMADLVRHYVPVTLEDFVAALEGRVELPRHACLITFDDGYSDFEEHALPVLERHSIPSTVFVTVEQARDPRRLMPQDAWYATLGTASEMKADDARPWIFGAAAREHHHAPPDRQALLRERLAQALRVGSTSHEGGPSLFLDEESLRSLSTKGVSLGAHGASHNALTALSDEALRAHLRACRAWLEEVAPRQPATLAYPFGRVDDRVEEATKAAGFCAAFTVRPCDGKPNAGHYLLKRSCVPGRPTAIEELVGGASLGI